MPQQLPAPVLALLERHGARAALKRELTGFGSLTKLRANGYARRIHNFALVDEDTVGATVNGTHPYECTWFFDGRVWEHDCTCPVGYLCKHAFAVAEALVLSPKPTRPQLPSPTQPRGHAVPTESVQTRILAQLRDTRGSWSRRRPLSVILRLNQLDHVDAYSDRFTEALEDIDPDVTCWKIACTLAEMVGPDHVPPVLGSYLKRTDLRDRGIRRATDAALRQLDDWTRERRRQGRKRLRFVAGLDPLRGGHLWIEGRVTATRLHDEPRAVHQLIQLREEAARDPLVLTSSEIRLLNAYLSRPCLSFEPRTEIDPAHFFHLATLGQRHGLIHWDDELSPEICDRTGLQPGQPVRCETTPVEIQPEVYAEGARLLTSLFAVWPDGRRRRLERCCFFLTIPNGESIEAVLVNDGYVWPVIDSPPDSLLRAFHAAGPVELPEQNRKQILTQLASGFANVESTLSLHTRYIPVDPVLLLELRRDDWLRIRFFARESGSDWSPGAPAPPSVHVYERDANDQWHPVTWNGEVDALPAGDARSEETTTTLAASESHSTQTESPDEIWYEAPDPTRLTPVHDWLQRVGALPAEAFTGRRRPQADDAEVGHWYNVTADSIELFLEHWNSRPPATYLGNRRLRRILSGTEVIRPTIKVTSSGTDWFSVSSTWASEGLALTDADLAKLRTSKSEFVRLPSGWVRRESLVAHDEAATTLADVGIEVGAGEQRITLWQLAGASESSLAALEAMGADPETLTALQRIRQQIAAFQGVPEVARPAALAAELRPYQRRGLDFLAHASNLGIGAILADDMGLGKTIQALAWICWLKQNRRGSGPILVVCPASVTHNWLREAERFAPKLKVLPLTSGADRAAQRKRVKSVDLVITNYALLRRDQEFWREVPLRAAILDEAQNIKNPDAVVAQVARSLDAKFRLALTGTPLENRALDLWSLVEFVNPGYLGRRSDFVTRFDRADAPPYQRQLLAAKLRPILLRRLKREVATELPERIEERIDCELTPGQRKLYLAELRRSRALVETLTADAEGLRRNKIQVLAALTRLRQICCHPGLVQAEKALGSGKFDTLFELLETLMNEGHKVLLFSQFVRCLQLLALELDRRGMPRHMLTGASRTRESIVRAFQEDERPCIFLVSLKAGGTGLNLTAASYVVLFDPWWNPAVEAQAIDRTHRIGQDKTVIAYRLLAAGTIEEKIFELQQRKALLARDIFGEDGFAKTLSRDDLDYLLSEA